MIESIHVRAARDEDLEAIRDIYAHYVLNTTTSFELEPPDIAELGRRRQRVLDAGLPYVVAEIAGRVVGYAFAASYRPRRAYRFTVEESIYVAPKARSRGIGQRLLGHVIDACADLGKQQMLAVIAGSDNAASIRFHHKLGFRTVGTFTRVGFKHDQWIDTVLMQRAL